MDQFEKSKWFDILNVILQPRLQPARRRLDIKC